MVRKSPNNPANAARLDEIIQSLPLGVHQYELNHDRLIFTAGNKAADTILGIRHDDLIGKSIEEAFPPLSQTEVPDKYKKIAVSGIGWEAEQITYEDNKISGVFQVYAFQTGPGKMAAVFRDITEKKKAEIAIRASEQKLRMLFENMVQGVMYLGTAGDITEVNASACKILGIPRDKILSLKSHDPGWKTIKEDGSPLPWEELPAIQAFLTGEPVKRTIIGVYNPLLKRNQWIMIDAIPEFKTGESKPFRVFITFSDITDQKEKEIELRWNNSQLEETRKELDRSLNSLASVNKSLLEMQVNLENKNVDLKAKNEEFLSLNQEFEKQNEQLRNANTKLEENNVRILEISRRIKNNEEQLRIILENSKDIIYSINYNSGTFEYISPVIKEILDIPVSEFMHQAPQTLYHLMHPDDVMQFGRHWLDVIELEEKEIFLFEIGYRLRDNEGHYHWMSESNKLLRDDEGKPQYLVGSIRDITEIKNSEIALKKSEERLSLAIEATSQGLWDIDQRTQTRYFSPRCFSMLGYLPGEIPFTGETIFSLIHPDEKDILLKKMYDFSGKNENPILLEFRIRHKSGEYIWISSRGKCVERDKKGNALRIVGTYTDITDRKLFELALKQKNEELLTAEEELRAINDELLLVNEKQEVQNAELQHTYEKLKVSEEKFKQLADNIEDVFWLREGSKLIYLSPSFEKVFGVKHKDAVRDPDTIRAVIHPDDMAAFRLLSGFESPETEGGITEQYRIFKPDGSIRWIWSRIFPVYTREGKLYRIAGIASDITLQKELENDLRMAKDKAQESDRLKSAFLANISHEIRTPMNGILGFAGLLTRNDLNEKTRGHYMEIVNKSGAQLLHIIEDLIDISKIEANQMQVNNAPCDINALLDELHIIYSRELKQIGKDHIELTPVYSSENNTCNIITDGVRLRQILNNLMNNAIKFTDKGVIRFGYEFEKPNQIRFFVEDSGIGIDPSMTEIIFMPFRQVDEGDARKYGGTGLGLPISLGLVKMLKGEIWLESVKEKGTTFNFTLPFKSGDAKSKSMMPDTTEESIQEWSDKRILIVEDDDMNYEFLNAILVPTSIAIDRAKDGVRAVSMCRENNYDLILMDIRLPVLDGIQATRQIREGGLTLPIIAQTAYAMANDKDKCLAAGCDDYVAKPIRKDSLISKLSRYLTDQGMRNEK